MVKHRKMYGTHTKEVSFKCVHTEALRRAVDNSIMKTVTVHVLGGRFVCWAESWTGFPFNFNVLSAYKLFISCFNISGFQLAYFWPLLFELPHLVKHATSCLISLVFQ